MANLFNQSFDPSSYLNAIRDLNQSAQQQSKLNQQQLLGFNNSLTRINQDLGLNLQSIDYNLGQYESGLNRQTSNFLGQQRATAASSGLGVNSKSFLAAYSDTLAEQESAYLNKQRISDFQRQQLTTEAQDKLKALQINIANTRLTQNYAQQQNQTQQTDIFKQFITAQNTFRDQQRKLKLISKGIL